MADTNSGYPSKLYYSIGEISKILAVKSHVLRYWETEFSMLRPEKNAAGQRAYRENDLKLLIRIKELLYDKGFTIKGAKTFLLAERKEERCGPTARSQSLKTALGKIKNDLVDLKAVLNKIGA